MQNQFVKEYVLLISKSRSQKLGYTSDNVVNACESGTTYFDPFFTLEEGKADIYFKKKMDEDNISIYVNEEWVDNVRFAGEFNFGNYNGDSNYFIAKDKFWRNFNKQPQDIVDNFYIVNKTFRYGY